MVGNPNPSERTRSIEFFLLAVGALTPIGSDSRALADACDRTSKRRGHDSSNSGLRRSLGLLVPAVVVKKQENGLHPDTGESGETYDVEAFWPAGLESSAVEFGLD